MVFLEALRQFQFRVGIENFLLVHVSLVPFASGEQKTKPTQHSVKELRSLGSSPDVIVCRSKEMLALPVREKMGVFCHVGPGHVLSVHDVSNIYHVPLMLADQGIHTIIKSRLNIDAMSSTPQLTMWKAMAEALDTTTTSVKVAIVGKYNGQQDSYLSIIKSLIHSGMHLNVSVEIQWVEASNLASITEHEDKTKYETAWNVVKSCAGVIVPGGFGIRGVEGKVAVAKYCRENKVPYLGVCLGMQVMVIEYARHVIGLTDATSAEFDDEKTSKNHVVVFMPEIDSTTMGGNMRLGARPTTITPKHPNGEASLATDVYGIEQGVEASVLERHRHRYEVNPDIVKDIQDKGLIFTGKDDRKERMEIAELPRSVHPFYFGTQFHPEFKSRPNRPSPPFYAFVATTIDNLQELRKAGEMWQNFAKDSSSSSSAIPSSPLGKRVRAMSQESEDKNAKTGEINNNSKKSKVHTPTKSRA